MSDKAKLIINHLVQARANSPTYGKGADDFKITTKTFINDLNDFDDETINRSFKRWREENREFPHVSDILKICREITRQRNLYSNQGTEFIAQIEQRNVKKTDADKQYVENMLSELKAQIKAEEDEYRDERDRRTEAEIGKHWNKLNRMQKSDIMQKLINSAQTPKK